MHGSDFDLRLFEEFADFQASSIFDSMLASQLLGMKRIGLAALLEEFFEVKLPKDSQKSDWSQLKRKDWVTISWKFVDKPKKAHVVRVLPPRDVGR